MPTQKSLFVQLVSIVAAGIATYYFIGCHFLAKSKVLPAKEEIVPILDTTVGPPNLKNTILKMQKMASQIAKSRNWNWGNGKRVASVHRRSNGRLAHHENGEPATFTKRPTHVKKQEDAHHSRYTTPDVKHDTVVSAEEAHAARSNLQRRKVISLQSNGSLF